MRPGSDVAISHVAVVDQKCARAEQVTAIRLVADWPGGVIVLMMQFWECDVVNFGAVMKIARARVNRFGMEETLEHVRA